MNNKYLLPLLCSLLPLAMLAQPKIKLVDFATGFTRPIGIEHSGDSRLYIIEKAGKIWVLDSLGNRQTDVFLDITSLIRSTGNEQGLLGLAFHPDYAQNGWFFVNYIIKANGNTRISRFTRSAVNPNVADASTELVILEQSQPYSNHNGGSTRFGPDGYLYLGLGDGGSGGDPQGNGQKTTTFLGKLLRIDVDSSIVGAPYRIPADNPFAGSTASKPEIWAYGLRNPWRFSFDRLNGDLWIGDVGQNAHEEIDYQPAGIPGGRNYGWNCFEGFSPYDGGCVVPNHIPPVFDYPNPSIGCSVTGGFRYRGSKYPDLYGKYLFTDYCSGRWWTLTQNANGSFTGAIIADLSDNSYTTLGEDLQGELYVATDGGKIQKITELCSGFNFAGTASGAVCDSSLSGTIFLNLTGGAAPVTYIWSNGASDKDIVYLNPGIYSVKVKDNNGCERRDTFEIESASPAAPQLSPTGDIFLCAGDTATITAYSTPLDSGVYVYQWLRDGVIIPNETFPVLITGESGQYRARLVGLCNSALSSVVNLQHESVIPPLVVAIGNEFVANGGSGASYQWLLNGQPIAGATDSIYVPVQSGDYAVIITSANGCTFHSGEIPFVVSGTVLPANVTKFSLAPNPTSDQAVLTMELQRGENTTISLTDSQGRTIFSQSHQDQKIVLPIDLRGLPAGTYFLHVQTEKGAFVRQLVRR